MSKIMGVLKDYVSSEMVQTFCLIASSYAIPFTSNED